LTRPDRHATSSKDLLAGIRGCWLLWLDHGDEDDGDELDAEMEDEVDEESDYKVENERLTQMFLDAVRVQTALYADRLE
jgi:hypothetical protein